MRFDKGFLLNALALCLAAGVVLARRLAVDIRPEADGLSVAFVTACFAVINRSGRTGADSAQPPS